MRIETFIEAIEDYNRDITEKIVHYQNEFLSSDEIYDREPDEFEINLNEKYLILNCTNNHYRLLKFDLKTGEFELNLESDLNNVYNTGINPILEVVTDFLTTKLEDMDIDWYLKNNNYYYPMGYWED